MLPFVFRPSSIGRSPAADELSLKPDTALKGIAALEGVLGFSMLCKRPRSLLTSYNTRTHVCMKDTRAHIRLTHVEAYRYSQTLKKDAGTEICALVTCRKRQRTLGLYTHTHTNTHMRMQNEE